MIHNDFYEPDNPKEGRSVGYGCILFFVAIIAVGCLLLFGSCEGNWKRNDPKAVTYREKVSDTDTSEIWRNVTYELVSVSYDTVPKVRRERSTIEPEILAPKVNHIPDDRVDLNDYLGDIDDETDWNYTEIGDHEQSVLDYHKIYWDSDKGYWRKR